MTAASQDGGNATIAETAELSAMRVRDNVRALAIARGHEGTEDLASAAGLAPESLAADYPTGAFTMTDLFKIARALHVPVSTLLMSAEQLKKRVDQDTASLVSLVEAWCLIRPERDADFECPTVTVEDASTLSSEGPPLYRVYVGDDGITPLQAIAFAHQVLAAAATAYRANKVAGGEAP